MTTERLQTGTSTQLYIQKLNFPQGSFAAFGRCGEGCINELFSPTGSHKTALNEALHMRAPLWVIKIRQTIQIR